MAADLVRRLTALALSLLLTALPIGDHRGLMALDRLRYRPRWVYERFAQGRGA